MKTYEFIFENIKAISDQTRLLELCDWSEERVNELFSHCTDIVQSLKESDADFHSSLEDIIEKRIRGDFTAEQKVAMKDIIAGLVKSTLSGFENES